MARKNKRRRSETTSPTQSRITKKVCSDANSTDTNKVVPEHLEALFRKTYKYNDKQMRFQLHHDTLQKYIDLDLIPKGLQITLNPSFGQDDADFMSNWQSILHQCSLQILELLISFCNKKVRSTGITLSELHINMEEQSNNPDELDKVQTKLDNMLSKRKTRILEIKEKKLQRDIVAKSRVSGTALHSGLTPPVTNNTISTTNTNNDEIGIGARPKIKAKRSTVPPTIVSNDPITTDNLDTNAPKNDTGRTMVTSQLVRAIEINSDRVTTSLILPQLQTSNMTQPPPRKIKHVKGASQEPYTVKTDVLNATL